MECLLYFLIREVFFVNEHIKIKKKLKNNIWSLLLLLFNLIYFIIKEKPDVGL